MSIIIAESFRNAIATIAENIPGAEGRGTIQSYLALQHTESGEIDTAVEIVDAIEDAYQRDFAFGQVAVKCVASGQADQSESVLDLIDDDGARAQATEKLAVAYVESADMERALEVAHSLPDPVPALSGVALACVGKGFESDASGLLDSIDYPDLRVPVLIELARVKLDAQDPDSVAALELLAEASKTAEEIEVSSQRIESQRSIISLYQKCGEEESALKILDHALDHVKGSENLDADSDRNQVASAYAELGRFEHAERVLEEIGDPYYFADAATTLATRYNEAGDRAKALTLLAEALEVIKGEEVYGEQTFTNRERMLDRLARGYAELKSFDTSMEILKLMNDERRDTALSAMARIAATSGEDGRALQLVEMIKDDSVKALCESQLVADFATSNQPEMAERVLSQALTHATALEHPANRAMVLADLAPLFHVREQAAKAHEILLNALRAVAEIDQLDLQASALISVASNYASLEQNTAQAEDEILEKITGKLD